MEKKEIGLGGVLGEVEFTREKLESAILIAAHLIDDMQDLGNLDPVAKEALVKLRGIYCIIDQVNKELDETVANEGQ